MLGVATRRFALRHGVTARRVVAAPHCLQNVAVGATNAAEFVLGCFIVMSAARTERYNLLYLVVIKLNRVEIEGSKVISF